NLVTNKDSMYQAAKKGYATATDLADYLVNKGLPFRDAHEVVGKAVAYAIQQGLDLSECSLEALQQFDARIEADVFALLSLEGSLNARNLTGGTAPAQIRIQIAACRELIAD
ncbi:MAG: argininosuccinate lyase, partial [Gammaproteobacteria bacterium]